MAGQLGRSSTRREATGESLVFCAQFIMHEVINILYSCFGDIFSPSCSIYSVRFSTSKYVFRFVMGEARVLCFYLFIYFSAICTTEPALNIKNLLVSMSTFFDRSPFKYSIFTNIPISFLVFMVFWSVTNEVPLHPSTIRLRVVNVRMQCLNEFTRQSNMKVIFVCLE